MEDAPVSATGVNLRRAGLADPGSGSGKVDPVEVYAAITTAIDGGVNGRSDSHVGFYDNGV